MGKRGGVGRHLADRTASMLEEDRRAAIRIRDESIGDRVDQFRRERIEESGLEVAAFDAWIPAVADTLYSDVDDGSELVRDRAP